MARQGAYSACGLLESAFGALRAARVPFEAALADSKSKSELLRSQEEQLRRQSAELAAANQRAAAAETAYAELLLQVAELQKRVGDAEQSARTSRRRARQARESARTSAGRVEVERELKGPAEAASANVSRELVALRDRDAGLERGLVDSQATVGRLDNLRLAFVHSCSQLGMRGADDLDGAARQAAALSASVRISEERAMETGIRLTFIIIRSHYDAEVGVDRMSRGFVEGTPPEVRAALEAKVRPRAERLLGMFREEFLPLPAASTEEGEKELLVLLQLPFPREELADVIVVDDGPFCFRHLDITVCSRVPHLSWRGAIRDVLNPDRNDVSRRRLGSHRVDVALVAVLTIALLFLLAVAQVLHITFGGADHVALARGVVGAETEALAQEVGVGVRVGDGKRVTGFRPPLARWGKR
ncbi:hypothetical protein EJB05_23708, partial [Eragrostis curvula]